LTARDWSSNKSLARGGTLFVAIKGASMWDYYHQAAAWLFRLDSQEWFMAMCAALIIAVSGRAQTTEE
jgi:hypothetical protein